MRFEGKVVIVTGGGSGIGRAICMRFAEEGAGVCVADLEDTSARETVSLIEEKAVRAIAVQGDVSKDVDAKQIVERTVKEYGAVHILVNNAAVFILLNTLDVTPEDWDRSMAVNVKGPALMGKYAVPEMAKVGGGAIINIAAINSLVGEADMAPYNTTKAALLGLTRSMAIDYWKHRVRVNAICPGIIYTAQVQRMLEQQNMTRAEFEKTGKWMNTPGMRIIMKRIGDPEEVANTALFLASEDSSYITGSYILVDGGHMAQ
jgi:NAD(P)-dependent dehydrogenase (short-subunit alcohol dehydrogenase family)